MALNSDEAVCRATNKLLDIVAREQQAQAQYIEQLIQERDAALEEAKEAKKEANMYRSQVQRYRSEVDTAKQQLAKTHARFSLTLVPVHDTEFTAADKHPGSSTPARDNSRSKRRKYPTTIQHPTPATNAATEDVILSRNPASIPSNPSDARTAPVEPSSANQPNSRHVVPKRSTNTRKTWCYCDKQEYGTMVMCSNSSCPKQWFHVPCTRLVQVPEGEWTCRICDPST